MFSKVSDKKESNLAAELKIDSLLLSAPLDLKTLWQLSNACSRPKGLRVGYEKENLREGEDTIKGWGSLDLPILLDCWSDHSYVFGKKPTLHTKGSDLKLLSNSVKTKFIYVTTGLIGHQQINQLK